MKKILALIATLGLIMACGGNSGNSGKSKMTVEDKAIDYLEQVSEANENYDYETLEKVYKEMEAWYNGLSEEDQAKADAAAEKYMLGEYGDDEEYYDDKDEEYYAAESESDDEGETDWDDLLDEYEEYVDELISLYEDAMAGDMDALAEYASVAEDAAALCEDLEGASSEMTASQASRLAKISQKLADSLQ